jgi:hypothetical protein
VATNLSAASSATREEAARRRDRVKDNREVELINKWKELDTVCGSALHWHCSALQVHDQLEKVREKKKDRFEVLAGRWRVVEVGQLQLKQNLVKFNNFVKEKQGKVNIYTALPSTHQAMLALHCTALHSKVEEGRIASKRFVDANRRREDKIRILDTEQELYTEALAALGRCVEQKRPYDAFLAAVASSLGTGGRGGKAELMARCESLVSSRADLHARLRQLREAEQAEAADLATFRWVNMNVVFNQPGHRKSLLKTGVAN